jgi:hypothetical protein
MQDLNQLASSLLIQDYTLFENHIVKIFKDSDECREAVLKLQQAKFKREVSTLNKLGNRWLLWHRDNLTVSISLRQGY